MALKRGNTQFDESQGEWSKLPGGALMWKPKDKVLVKNLQEYHKTTKRAKGLKQHNKTKKDRRKQRQLDIEAAFAKLDAVVTTRGPGLPTWDDVKDLDQSGSFLDMTNGIVVFKGYKYRLGWGKILELQTYLEETDATLETLDFDELQYFGFDHSKAEAIQGFSISEPEDAPEPVKGPAVTDETAVLRLTSMQSLIKPRVKKPVTEAKATTVYLLHEVDSDKVIGVYHDEAIADQDAEEFYKEYQIDTYLKEYKADTNVMSDEDFGKDA